MLEIKLPEMLKQVWRARVDSLWGTTHFKAMAGGIWTFPSPTANGPGHRKYPTSMPIPTISALHS